jgi:TonB family protein
MEYAEQTLAQVLPQRALTPDEAREMLLPTLGALAFLHRKNLVQGQLKPTNFLVVNDQLKLASDTVRAAGEPPSSGAKSSVYEAPEVRNAGLSPASDIWGLGVTVVEALTQHLPAWPDERAETARLPATLPPLFADTAQRCLSRNPARRPTAAGLEAQFKPAPQAPVVANPRAVVHEDPVRAEPPPETPRQRLPVSTILTVLVVLIAVWAGARLFKSHPSSPPVAANTAASAPQPNGGLPVAAVQNPATPAAAPAPVSTPAVAAKPRESKPAPARALSHRPDQPAQAPADTAAAVVHEQIPAVPRSARETIHGHIKVAVVVIVDPSGNVIDALLENPGPSWYFARLARDAARKWKFTPAAKQDSREWLLRFEFSRAGTTGHSATQRS